MRSKTTSIGARRTTEFSKKNVRLMISALLKPQEAENFFKRLSLASSSRRVASSRWRSTNVAVSFQLLR
jgi:hypothetical protein